MVKICMQGVQGAVLWGAREQAWAGAVVTLPAEPNGGPTDASVGSEAGLASARSHLEASGAGPSCTPHGLVFRCRLTLGRVKGNSWRGTQLQVASHQLLTGWRNGSLGPAGGLDSTPRRPLWGLVVLPAGRGRTQRYRVCKDQTSTAARSSPRHPSLWSLRSVSLIIAL